MSAFDERQVRFREAIREDAKSISLLYRQVYGQRSYPFPQFLDEDWVANAIQQDGICWIVADENGELLSAAGATRNVGNEKDAVAEAFGLVVDQRARRRGLATGTFEYLCHCLKDARFIIAETRTSEPGGWRVVRRCGFTPMGFEPFAHYMPVGLESMLLTGKLSTAAIALRRQPKCVTPQVLKLMQGVLPGVVLECAEVSSPFEAPTKHDLPIEVVRDDVAGQTLLDNYSKNNQYASGVVSLRRLVGEDSKGGRYDNRYFVARQSEIEVGAVHVVWDRLDGRVRILDLRCSQAKIENTLLGAVFKSVLTETGPDGLIIVVDVLADHFVLQLDLESRGLVPTVYYPSLIGHDEVRSDAVQYTFLHNRRLEDSTDKVSALGWPEAARVIDNVIGVTIPQIVNPQLT